MCTLHFCEPKVADPDRFYLPHTTSIKQNVVFKGKSYIFSCLSFSAGHYSSIFLSYFSVSSPSTDLFLLCHRLYEIMFYDDQIRQCQVMSLAYRNKNCNYCCSMNSTATVIDRHCFTGNFKGLHSSHVHTLSN